MRKMMNYIKALALSMVAMVSVNSCDTLYDPLDTICDVAWYSDQFKPPYTIAAGDCISFMNASQGMLSSAWVIDEGCNFMVDNYNASGDKASQVDYGKGLRSNRLVETVYFPKDGAYTVRMRAIFPEKVWSHDSDPTEAVFDKESGFWLFEKELLVNVSGVLAVGYRVTDSGGNLLLERNPGDANPAMKSIDIDQGEILCFEALATGGMSSATWTVPGGELLRNEGSKVYYQFNDRTAAGSSLTGANVKITRDDPAATASSNVNLSINVKGVPFAFAAAAVDISVDPTKVYITATDSFTSVPTGTGIRSFKFFITDIDGEKHNQTDTVESVIINPENDKQIIVTLYEPICAGDSVTLTYQGTNIFGTDDTLLVFENQVVAVNGESALNIYAGKGFDFDLGATYVNNMWSNVAAYYQEFNTAAITSAVIYNGTYSLLLQYPEGGFPAVSPNGVNMPAALYVARTNPGSAMEVPAGDYILNHWIYVDSCDTSALEPDQTLNYIYERAPFNPTGNVTGAYVDQVSIEVPAERGTWVKISKKVTYGEDTVGGMTNYKFRLTLPNDLPGGFKAYFDNFELIPAQR